MLTSKNFKIAIMAGVFASLSTTGSGYAESTKDQISDILSPQDKVTSEMNGVKNSVKSGTRMILAQMKGDLNGDNMTNDSEVAGVRSGLGDLMADVQIETNKKFISDSDKQLFLDYKAQLGDSPKMQELAMELVKGMNEYIYAILTSEKFTKGRYAKKTPEYKFKKAISYWNPIAENFLEGEVSSGYKKLASRTPMLLDFIAENYDILKQDKTIGKSVELVMSVYRTNKMNANADIRNANADIRNANADIRNANADIRNANADKYNKIAAYLAQFSK